MDYLNKRVREALHKLGAKDIEEGIKKLEIMEEQKEGE